MQIATMRQEIRRSPAILRRFTEDHVEANRTRIIVLVVPGSRIKSRRAQGGLEPEGAQDLHGVAANLDTRTKATEAGGLLVHGDLNAGAPERRRSRKASYPRSDDRNGKLPHLGVLTFACVIPGRSRQISEPRLRSGILAPGVKRRFSTSVWCSTLGHVSKASAPAKPRTPDLLQTRQRCERFQCAASRRSVRASEFFILDHESQRHHGPHPPARHAAVRRSSADTMTEPPWPVRIASALCDGCYHADADSCAVQKPFARPASIDKAQTAPAEPCLVSSEMLGGSSIRLYLARVKSFHASWDVPSHPARSRAVIHLVFDDLASF